jgi:hypothetical protein
LRPLQLLRPSRPLSAEAYFLCAFSKMGRGPIILCRGTRHPASPLGRGGRSSWADRSIRCRWNNSRGWFGPWRLFASNFPSPMRKVNVIDQNKSSYRWYEIKKGYLPYFCSGRLIVAECTGTVSKWPRRAGDGWREITLLPNPRTRPPAPRTPRGTVAEGSSATVSSSAIFCLLGDEDVSSTASVSSFVRG